MEVSRANTYVLNGRCTHRCRDRTAVVPHSSSCDRYLSGRQSVGAMVGAPRSAGAMQTEYQSPAPHLVDLGYRRASRGAATTA